VTVPTTIYKSVPRYVLHKPQCPLHPVNFITLIEAELYIKQYRETCWDEFSLIKNINEFRCHLQMHWVDVCACLCMISCAGVRVCVYACEDVCVCVNVSGW
jgi:hypothetical protein